jgi:hypothetical protein
MATVQIPGHGNYRLKLAAAQSIQRIDKQRKAQGRAPLNITSALRTVKQQLALIARWIKGGVFNRPPYLFKPAMVPRTPTRPDW